MPYGGSAWKFIHAISSLDMLGIEYMGGLVMILDIVNIYQLLCFACAPSSHKHIKLIFAMSVPLLKSIAV